MRRRHYLKRSALQPQSLLPLVAEASQGQGQRGKIKCRILIVFSCFSVLFAVVYFLLLEFSWVHRRCAKALFIPTIVNSVECSEARFNKKATLDPSLWPPGLRDSVKLADEPAKHVHYTITSPLIGEPWDLALCSMEATSNHLCANGSDSTGKHPCFINVWIVDQAAESVLHLSSTRLLLDITITLESTNNTSWCVRIIDPVSQDSSQDLLIGNNCPSIQSDRSRTAAASLRKWLGSPQARQQIPAHLSDAWRLVALLEVGGLYLDADVLPIPPRLLQLPSPSVPAQGNAGAYRLNGGVLRLGDNKDEHYENATAFRRHPTSFLAALERDHMTWAPRLAQLPKEKQTFGFLGPAALTRVYTLRAYQDRVKVLPPRIVEPAVVRGESLCRDSLAAHFSGTNKQKWKALIRNTCLEKLVELACPYTLQTRRQ